MSDKQARGLYGSLWNIGVRAIRSLEADRGILASGRDEVYGCIFGRDSLITSLSLLKVYEKSDDPYYLSLVRKVLLNLADLQGRVVNIESGEEPGKIIHEYRPDRHEHLTAHPEKPWYLYGDNIMRNYDTADATPLFLMVVHEYQRVTGDKELIRILMPNIRAAIDWMRLYGDSNGDGFLDYRVHPDRQCGGLQAQSWMDSHESVFFEETEEAPRYPIAPVEVQAYAYAAYRAWADYFAGKDRVVSADLSRRADVLKSNFNQGFRIDEKRGRVSLAFAIDGAGRPLVSPRSSMGHCLWAVWRSGRGEMPDCIIAREHVASIARRILTPDLYVPRAGIRTLSVRSRRYDHNSYHNGSIWPHDTAMCAEGLETHGFREEAKRVRRGLVAAFSHFQTPVELFTFNKGYGEYCGANGERACQTQAWSAASLLAILHEELNISS